LQNGVSTWNFVFHNPQKPLPSLLISSFAQHHAGLGTPKPVQHHNLPFYGVGPAFGRFNTHTGERAAEQGVVKAEMRAFGGLL
jgi:hypothetical protein